MASSLRCGIRLHDTAPGTLTERLAGAAKQGFCCAHVALSKIYDGFSMGEATTRLTADFAEEVGGAFQRTGMRCALLGCYLQLAQKDGEALEKTREIYRAHLRFARLMGAELVGTETPAKGLRFADGPAAESEEAFRLLIRGLRPLIRDAEEEGVTLAVEPVFCDIVSTPERAERMLDALGSDRVQIILDAVNLLSNETAQHPDGVIGEAIRRLGDRVRLLHMKDFMLSPVEARPLAAACGQGGMRYEALVSFALRRGLPMTLENTAPDNAEAARLYLEAIAGKL